MSAASGGNSEPKQGQRSQSARGFCPRSTMRVPQPDIIEHFGNADAVPQLPERCLSRKAGIVRCCLKKPWNPQRIPAALCLKSCLCLRNIRHFLCFQIHLSIRASKSYCHSPCSCCWQNCQKRFAILAAAAVVLVFAARKLTAAMQSEKA